MCADRLHKSSRPCGSLFEPITIAILLAYLLGPCQASFTPSGDFTRKNNINSPNYLRNRENKRFHLRNVHGINVRGGSLTSLFSSRKLSNEVKPKTTTNEEFDFAFSNFESIKTLLKVSLGDVEDGLSSDDVSLRLAEYGPNKLESATGKSVFQLVSSQFNDRLVQILIFVALLSGIFSFFEHLENQSSSLLQSFVEPFVIITILVLNAVVGVWQELSAEDSLDALKKMQPTLATVKRDGVWLDGHDATTLVPGDIISVRVGDRVPADTLLLSLQTSSMSVDEGSLTGESVTVEKVSGQEGRTSSLYAPIQDQRGIIFTGTMVTSGAATGIVIRTGMSTEIGKIQQGVAEAKQEEQKTPLAQRLDEFGETLTFIIGIICVVVWVVSIPKFSDPSFDNWAEGAIYYAKVAVALGVAAIPEGLPAVITLCLSLGTRRMAQRNVIVRKLPSVETLGCTSVICTDKTGTLTTNEMTVVSLVLFEDTEDIVQEYSVSGFSYNPVGSVEGISVCQNQKLEGSVRDVAAVCALCNDAKIIGIDSYDAGTHKEDSNSSVRAYERVGEPTEAALCILAEKIGGAAEFLDTEMSLPPSKLASFHTSAWRDSCARVATLEFNRDRKSMSVLCKEDADNKHNKLFVKGAPNLLFQRCTHIKLRNGKTTRLTGAARRNIEGITSQLAQRPLRCIALAIKNSDRLESSLKYYDPEINGTPSKHILLGDSSNYEAIESGLTLVGIVGIKDPARPEVAGSIERCREAGIRVIMITGDAKDTAASIARDVNIFTEGDEEKTFEGREFFKLSPDEQLSQLSSGNLVFCRAEPSDKQKLIKKLQKLHEIPAMTGDGVNDAPALQQSAIGIAMGITGTEVAKEAADMILVDDNFSTIVSAIEEGRSIYANMQAFICFLISCNIGEICAILLATLAGIPEPLSAMHLLWVNLVTDGPPATALGFNPPSPDSMKEKPRPYNEPIMTRWMLTRYCITGFYVGLATVGIFIEYYLDHGVTLSQLSSWSKCGELWSANGLDCEYMFQGAGRALPQTLSLTVLVCMEMMKALSAVSVNDSIFQVAPWDNKWLILGVSIPFLLHLGVLYSRNLGVPVLGDAFGLVPLSLENWIDVLKWSAPILLLDEVLKLVGRKVVNKKRSEEDSPVN